MDRRQFLGMASLGGLGASIFPNFGCGGPSSMLLEMGSPAEHSRAIWFEKAGVSRLK
jgi:hypothetical protein